MAKTKAKSWIESEPLREHMLTTLADDLAFLGRREVNSRSELKLWRVEVALLDDRLRVVRVMPMTEAFQVLIDKIHQDVAAVDLSPATHAHLQVFEGDCVRCLRTPGSPKWAHVESEEG